MPLTEHDTCESLLAAMVGFDTVNSDISGRPDAEAELAAYLDDVAQAMGFATRRFAVNDQKFNLMVTHRADEAAPWVLFESHMDTVTVEGMTIEPFAGEIRDGKIFGRGACDTKGTGAAMLWALQQHASAGGGPNNVAIVFTTDEEISKLGVKSFTGRHLEQIDWRPQGVVIGEPTQLRAVTAHNGIVRWSIQTRGVAAHSADPAQGRSAISMMTRVIDTIETQYVPSLAATHPMTGKAQCSINVIRGGVQVNVIPEACEIQIDRRLVPGEDGTDVLPAVEKLLDALRGQDPKLIAQQQTPYIDLPLDPTGGEAFSAAVQKVLEGAALSTEPQGAPYATDASQFAEIGLPAVVLGPGNIAQAHTKDEWLSLDQLQRGVQVYRGIMAAPLA